MKEKEEEEKLKAKRRKVKEHEPVIEEEVDFDEEEITAFGLPMDFGSTKKR